uniref:Uncharacterized protein n=1 Tax=Triticum urartu TaxID=4572 RepID=A0A8R7R1G4_TRIUA
RQYCLNCRLRTRRAPAKKSLPHAVPSRPAAPILLAVPWHGQRPSTVILTTMTPTPAMLPVTKLGLISVLCMILMEDSILMMMMMMMIMMMTTTTTTKMMNRKPHKSWETGMA